MINEKYDEMIVNENDENTLGGRLRFLRK